MAEAGGSSKSVPVGQGRAPKMPKVARVKNKAPASLQITAEQLLREAKERQLEIVPAPPKQKIQDAAELADYQMRKRKEFEDNIRKNRTVMANWFKYAAWEEQQKELDRARSVYERSLDVDHRNIALWLKYAEMEMKNKQVNHARNLWDRAVTILPRANQLWLKYTYMEETVGNVIAARAVFERWMEWEPDEQYWSTFVNFELRYKELERAREIFERFVAVHSDVKNWIRFANFEQRHGFVNSSRRIYERAVEFFGDEYLDEELLVKFAQFEEGQKEHERARSIFRYSLDRLPKERCGKVYEAYTVHEKKFGERLGIESVITKKRKLQYEEEVAANPTNYDAWFDFVRLVRSDGGDRDEIRETYERAVSNVPPSKDKQFWRRYVYLWIGYAVYEELEARDAARARDVYRTCLDLIPHKRFTFAKVWLLYAQFEIRQRDVAAARRALGTAIGKCPKSKLFRGYIDLEIHLREFHRCRLLYEKFLLFDPENCTAWMKFAELEALLGDVDRARAVYELAVSRRRLDMPELLWKAYVDFEVEMEEADRARELYRRLLQKTRHVKVWLSFAQFEFQAEHDDSVAQARHVFEEGNRSLREAPNAGEPSGKESRLMLLEAWREFEEEQGDDGTRADVAALQPKRVKRRTKVGGGGDPDVGAGWEEYFDYIFPEDEGAKPNLRLLAMAKMWKKQKEEAPQQPEEEEEKAEEAGGSDNNPDADDKELRNEEESSDGKESSDGEESADGGEDPKAKRIKKG